MPNTTDNFDIPYLDGTELVRDYPQFSEDLADAVDAGLVAAGTIKQVVRATDATTRSTSSGSFVDASISVTITPEKSDSDILLLWVAAARDPGGTNRLLGAQITDSSNVAISGAENMTVGNTASLGAAHFSLVLVGYATPGSTSAQTFKGRFRSDNGLGTAALENSQNTGQLYAIEVSA